MIPVTILGGYLGSGKTTLVNHLLRNASGRKLAVLVNDFGDLSIDADLIEAEDGDLISLAGGCVCCSFGSDLMGALSDIIKRDPPPDHIVLEASGVALPGTIAGSLSLMQGLSSSRVVVLVDAEQIRTVAADTYMSDTILRQLSAADLLVIAKPDLISNQKLAALRIWLTEHAPQARIIYASHGVVDPHLILDNVDAAQKTHTGDAPHHDIGNLKTEIQFETGQHDIETICERLSKDPSVVRAKGHVVGLDGSIHTIQVVGHRYSVTPAAQFAQVGIVVIRNSQV